MIEDDANLLEYNGCNEGGTKQHEGKENNFSFERGFNEDCTLQLGDEDNGFVVGLAPEDIDKLNLDPSEDQIPPLKQKDDKGHKEDAKKPYLKKSIT